MKKFLIAPDIFEYKNFESFAQSIDLHSNDLIITNRYILNNTSSYDGCHILFQEEYGTGEPTDIMINKILAELSLIEYDRIVGIGGGTVLDIAKILAVAGKGETVDDLYHNMKTLEKKHKLFLIPTTCGTGSEMTNISVVNRTQLGTKQGLVSDCMYADSAVLVSEFIESLPYQVFATSSLDALIHAVESYLSPNATEYSRIFSIESIRLILCGYQLIRKNPTDFGKQGEIFLRASNYAGIAFGNAGCATVHAMSYAFGGKYHIPHGEANCEFLLEVLRFYEENQINGYMEKLLAVIAECIDDSQVDTLGGLDELLNHILVHRKMREYGATQEDIELFAQSTFDNQQRLLNNSYIPMNKEDIATIYRKCL